MNKNLFLLVALCAVSAESFSMEEPVSACRTQTYATVPAWTWKGHPLRVSRYVREEPVSAYRTQTYATVPAWTTWKGHPLRVSTYVPGMQRHLGDTLTPCVDVACAALVTAGLGYGLYSQRAQIARGAKAVASGTKSAVFATGLTLKSGAQTVGAGLVAGVKATPTLAGKLGGAALYPVGQAVKHPTASLTGAGVAGALAMVWTEKVSKPAALEKVSKPAALEKGGEQG